MLGSFRKFSSSIYAKVFLFIVAIPFVFWGMGDVFSGGNKNTIAKIGREKISTEEFINFVKYNAPQSGAAVIDKKLIEKMLSDFIGEKLIFFEIKDLEIKLSDRSLGTMIKNEKIFKKNNEFSRLAYEEFLIKNGIGAVAFEANMSRQIKRQQFFNYIGGGILPSSFLVNIDYNKTNQIRNVESLNLNTDFKNKIITTDDQINSYFEKNKEKYIDNFKTINFIELNPKILTESDEYSNLFFEKIDEIDDMVVSKNSFVSIANKFNIKSFETVTFNKLGKNKKQNVNPNFSKELVKKVFYINKDESIIFLENKDKYYLVELIKNENVQRTLNDKAIKNEILKKLENLNKKKLISNIVSKINKKTFKKEDFYKLAKDENVLIQKIKLNNANDTNNFGQDTVKQIYAYPEKKLIAVYNIDLTDVFLIYIDEIKESYVKAKSEDYKKYENLSKLKITSSLYNSYDFYLKNKYEIDINYKALDVVDNYFR